jgi:hypothetical protein
MPNDTSDPDSREGERKEADERYERQRKEAEELYEQQRKESNELYEQQRRKARAEQRKRESEPND